VIILTKAVPGKVHDKKQLDKEDFVAKVPDEVLIQGDLGFQGLQKEFVNIQLPHKKPKGKELADELKEENREFSRQRVKCEHAHAGIKRYNIAAGIYRNRKANFDDLLMLVSTGLWNFYLDAA
jgi:DDE superfamily endonuclease